MLSDLPKRLALRGLAGALSLAALSLPALAADPIYVPLASDVKGVYYTPDSGEAKIAFLVMHEDSNFLNHVACTELSKRGFAVLCVNGRSDNNEALDTWTELPLDTALAMKYLREDKGFGTVLLFAHSGGGPLMSYYQAVAEGGVPACSGEGKLSPCDDKLAGLPKADGMVFFDAHPGTGINLLRSLDPSVTDEDDPTKTDPSLDPFNPANGYNAEGPSSYSEEFRQRYFVAQAERMNRLVDKALAMRKASADGTGPHPDDETFYIPRATARLMQLDTSIEAATEEPRKFLKNDGTVVTEIVHTVRQPSLSAAANNKTYWGGTLLTVESFLGTRAVRAKQAMTDIDIASNNNSTGANLQHITVPILMMAAGGHYFIRDDEEMFESAPSADKDFIVVEGAAHGVVPCKPCAKATGQDYSNSVKNTFDYIAGWVGERFKG